MEEIRTAFNLKHENNSKANLMKIIMDLRIKMKNFECEKHKDSLINVCLEK